MRFKITTMKTLSIILFLCISFIIKAQQADTLKTKLRKNKITFEIGGKNLLYGLNYERQLLKKNNHTFFGCIGVGTNVLFPDYSQRITLPINIAYHFGVKKSKLYASIGVINLFATAPYPQNDSLRKEVAKNPDKYQEGSMYQAKYQLYFNQNIGYAFDAKKIIFRCYLSNYLFKTIYKPMLIQSQQFFGLEIGYKF
jgi:hypothetical protein